MGNDDELYFADRIEEVSGMLQSMGTVKTHSTGNTSGQARRSGRELHRINEIVKRKYGSDLAGIERKRKK
jgi:hypothetical protein